MNEPSLTILPETAGDAAAVDRLHERTFGPGRYARTAFRIREGRGHVLELSFTARIGTLLVGSVRLTPICIGETPALLLGPLTVEPPFRSHGVGTALVKRALKEADSKGHKLVVLVGDEPIYKKSGFKRIAKGHVKMPGPVDPARLLVAELKTGAFDGVKGVIRPDWEKA
jgi:predicted N-acetyltransferase YhbS